jgi:hypothetical protein
MKMLGFIFLALALFLLFPIIVPLIPVLGILLVLGVLLLMFRIAASFGILVLALIGAAYMLW